MSPEILIIKANVQGLAMWLELKPISEQKVENLFVAPPYCQTECYAHVLFSPRSTTV